MANYKDINGFPIQNLSSDSTSVGQIYYNTSSGEFKAVKEGGVSIGTWSSGGNINNPRQQAGGDGATQNASWIIGGSPGLKAFHEQYDGTSWTEATDLGTAKYGMMAFGTTTAAVSAGGYDGAYENDVEVWNGSSWTEVNDINTIRGYGGGAGSTTAGLVFGGHPGGLAVTESWDGTNWTEVADLNAGRDSGMRAGTQTAAIFSGGEPGGSGGAVELWDGSSWTETTELNTARKAGWGFGTSTAQIVCGGGPSYTGATESWNGSAWTEVADLATASASNNPNGGGSASAGVIAARYAGGTSFPTASEEWNAADFEVKTLTTS